MGFTVEQECPQCGAPIELDETDHLLRCPYCDIKNFLYASKYYRFVLPHKSNNKDMIFAPYLRFKGSVYFCKDTSVQHRFIDITNVGMDLKGLPISLGLRPQAMKMKFVKPDMDGMFLRFTYKAHEIVTRAGKLSSGSSKDQILHRSYIGETMSLIYLPLYVENERIYDGVLGRSIAKLPDGLESLEQFRSRNPTWKIKFIPTICPKCGWNLEGERDSVVLTCYNCETAWEMVDGKFSQVEIVLAKSIEEDCHYLPFWKTAVKIQGVEIDSFADFIRVTNQPRIVGKEWEKMDMCFWSPAFRIRPKIFLNVSKRFTVSQKEFNEHNEFNNKELYPVTLPSTEAAQAMKTILARSAVTKKNIFPFLPSIRFKIKSTKLIYLPFTDTGHEMEEQHTGISINKNSLQFGRKL